MLKDEVIIDYPTWHTFLFASFGLNAEKERRVENVFAWVMTYFWFGFLNLFALQQQYFSNTEIDQLVPRQLIAKGDQIMIEAYVDDTLLGFNTKEDGINLLASMLRRCQDTS